MATAVYLLINNNLISLTRPAIFHNQQKKTSLTSSTLGIAIRVSSHKQRYLLRPLSTNVAFYTQKKLMKNKKLKLLILVFVVDAVIYLSFDCFFSVFISFCCCSEIGYYNTLQDPNRYSICNQITIWLLVSTTTDKCSFINNINCFINFVVAVSFILVVFEELMGNEEKRKRRNKND